MAITPRFGYPYLTLSDPPDLAGITEDLATVAEAQTARAYPVANAAARTALTSVGTGFLVTQADDESLWKYTALGTWQQVGASGGGGGGGSLVVASYSNSANQTFGTSGSEYPVSFPSGSDSASVVRSTKGVGHKFTVQPGTYLVDTTVRFGAGSTGSRFIGLRTNDDVAQYASAQNDGGPAAATRTFSKVITLNSAADLYLVASQSSGGSLATQATSTQAPSGYVQITFTRLG